jgi:hypothetical protein
MDISTKSTGGAFYYLIQFILIIVVIVGFILLSAFIYKVISGWSDSNSEKFTSNSVPLAGQPMMVPNTTVPSTTAVSLAGQPMMVPNTTVPSTTTASFAGQPMMVPNTTVPSTTTVSLAGQPMMVPNTGVPNTTTASFAGQPMMVPNTTVPTTVTQPGQNLSLTDMITQSTPNYPQIQQTSQQSTQNTQNMQGTVGGQPTVQVVDVTGKPATILTATAVSTLAASSAKHLNPLTPVPINTVNGNTVQVQVFQLQSALGSIPTESINRGEVQQEVISGISSEAVQNRISKTFYNKYEEILYPSSQNPYIGRDTVAYRGSKCDSNFIQNRPFALACQVDSTPNWPLQNYDNTKTNIIKTCVYNDKSSDPDVWTRDKCMSECGKIPDLTNQVSLNMTNVSSAGNSVSPQTSYI